MNQLNIHLKKYYEYLEIDEDMPHPSYENNNGQFIDSPIGEGDIIKIHDELYIISSAFGSYLYEDEDIPEYYYKFYPYDPNTFKKVHSDPHRYHHSDIEPFYELIHCIHNKKSEN